MAERRARGRAVVATEDADSDGLTKAQLQQRIEETRESISQTVDEIKETVTDQYVAVKETVADVIGWNEEFKKNPVVWGLGAVSVGLVIGYSIAMARQDAGGPSTRRRRSDSSVDNFFDGLSRVGMNMVLPMVTQKVKDLFGVDLSQHLTALTSNEPERPAPRTRRRATQKRTTRRASKKQAGGKAGTKKRGAK